MFCRYNIITASVAFALIIIAVLNVGFCEDTDIDPGKCVVWGPGLNAHVVLPVRYFYIQTVDSHGTNITVSPGNVYDSDHYKVCIVSICNII